MASILDWNTFIIIHPIIFMIHFHNGFLGQLMMKKIDSFTRINIWIDILQ